MWICQLAFRRTAVERSCQLIFVTPDIKATVECSAFLVQGERGRRALDAAGKSTAEVLASGGAGGLIRL